MNYLNRHQECFYIERIDSSTILEYLTRKRKAQVKILVLFRSDQSKEAFLNMVLAHLVQCVGIKRWPLRMVNRVL